MPNLNDGQDMQRQCFCSFYQLLPWLCLCIGDSSYDVEGGGRIQGSLDLMQTWNVSIMVADFVVCIAVKFYPENYVEIPHLEQFAFASGGCMVLPVCTRYWPKKSPCAGCYDDATVSVVVIVIIYECQAELCDNTCDWYFWLVARLLNVENVLSVEDQSNLCFRLADLIIAR